MLQLHPIKAVHQGYPGSMRVHLPANITCRPQPRLPAGSEVTFCTGSFVLILVIFLSNISIKQKRGESSTVTIESINTGFRFYHFIPEA